MKSYVTFGLRIEVFLCVCCLLGYKALMGELLSLYKLEVSDAVDSSQSQGRILKRVNLKDPTTSNATEGLFGGVQDPPNSVKDRVQGEE